MNLDAGAAVAEQALTGLRVVDLTTDFGYASKLFADLGATVVRVEPPGGSRARARPPLAAGTSLWFDYRNGGAKPISLDFDSAADRVTLHDLVAGGDIVLDDRLQSFWLDRGLHWAALNSAAPGLVWCAITPFGQTGPAAGADGCDLIAMASGGMAWLSGYEDSGPYAGDCGLATTSCAQYAAVVALIAALGRNNVGGGQFIDVSMQEVMALGTETAPQFLEMKGVLRRRLGEHAKQAGIGVYPCADGHVFLYAAESGVGRGWNLLVDWIAEAVTAAADALRDPRWQDNAFKALPEQRARFAAIWRDFARDRSKQSLFVEGQRRRIAITPVNGAVDVLADPHLNARRFFDMQGRPGAPYRLSATPWHRASSASSASPATSASSTPTNIPTATKPDKGWMEQHWPGRQARSPALPAVPAVAAGSAGKAGLPLAGLRVVDLTWVGAGPFTTKLLADFGAEVWKIESRQRPDQLRRAEPVSVPGNLDASGYFANRNTNKKSVTLDLKRAEDVAHIREMLRTADVLANSFSPGVMERLGLSWSEVSRINPRLITLGMPFAGDDGPYRDYLGYGINIAALVGLFARHRLPERLPVGTGTNFPDHLPNPLHACFAVLAALAWRLRSGLGQAISVAQVESTLAASPDGVLEAAATGRESAPAAYVEPWRAPHGMFRCAGDDRWCALSIADDDSCGALLGLLGRSDLPLSSRRDDRSMVEQLVRDWTATRSAEVAVDALRGAGIAASIVATPEDLLHHDSQLAARHFWQYLDHPVMGRGVYHGVPAAFSLTSTRYRSGAPLLGEHNAELAHLLTESRAGHIVVHAPINARPDADR